ncbi:MAG TPA: hypothetical protein VMW35_03120 [Myxococcota bacterium]|jgi:tetratricopeptide (TPR) repeat protein|nr:hypothetical protein [Myxococcota bacterium]
MAAGTLALTLAVGCAPGVSTSRLGPPPTAEDRARFARYRVDEARQYQSQGRTAEAESSLREALRAAPDDAVALRSLARQLEEEGRGAEAAPLRAHADAVDPPPAPPPDVPLGVPAEGLLVLLAPASDDASRAEGGPRFGDPLVPDALAQRLALRLPGTRVVELTPTTVPEARAWLEAHRVDRILSLQVERATCGRSQKDGPFALVWLRAAVATPSGIAVAPRTWRESDGDPAQGQICVLRPLARALEKVLSDPPVRAALDGPAARGAWPSEALRAAFPVLETRLAAELERGRARLAEGRLPSAARAFERAGRVDPDDADTRAYLSGTQASLALARDLHGAPLDPGSDDDADLDSALTPAAREAAERELEQERRLRDQLLAAVAVLSGEEPDAEQLRAALRPVELPVEETVGLRLARDAAGGPVERRALFAPDGRALASWYFDTATGEPVLREEDRNHDGRPETWALWHDGRRSEVYEDRSGSGRPDTRVLLAPDGSVARIEMTSGPSGAPSRIFEYGSGRLVSESRDTDGDGRLDRFEKFDADGVVTERAQDLDGDGTIDVRSFYAKGKLVRREVTDPARVGDLR